jgi:hypothetical protein
MIKKIAFYLIAGIVTMLSGCVDPDMGKTGDNTSLPDELSLRFSFTIPGNTVVNTRSIDPDGEPVSSIWLFLFNGSGYYLGHVRANEVTYQKTDTNEGGTFSTPSIPSTVRRIHFIANYNAADVDDSELLNRTEKEVMTRFTSSSGRLVYWGRKSYFKDNFTSPIILYRNQAAITYNKNNLNLNIQGFAICNTYAKGTVVPYNHQNETDPFNFDLTESQGHAVHDYVTLCSGEDLIKATDPEDTEVQNEWGLRYIFEHENAQDDPMFAIFKIDGKYYKLMIVDDQSNPYKIIRNHRYIFNFHSAPPTTLGYATFEEAKNGVAANNVWVSIDNELPSIGDGTSALTIEGETTRIYTERKDEVINFTCTGGITSDQVTATWLSNEGLASSDLNLQYDPATGKGSVTVSLNEIADTPQYGTLQIKAGKYPRTIQIVYLNKFDFAPVWTSSSVPRRSGEPVSIVFNIPDTYPEELFPVECKISCNLFDANTNNQLEVIEEETAFTIDGVKVERDWDYKYVYKADKPGLHRVDFKTLMNSYPANPDSPATENEVLTWFLEAPYFNTIERTINMVDSTYADQKIIIYETTLNGNQASGTYERKIAPIKGQTFDLKFYLENGTPANTKIRIYMDKAVEPGYQEGKWPANLSEARYDAPDAGRYFIYTVPDTALLDKNNRYLVSIPFRTVSAQCEGYARIAAASTDNDADHCYKSAIVTRVNNPEAYNFNLQANNTKELSLPYGTGQEVTLSITPDLGSHTVSSCKILIKTQNLEPADKDAVVWDNELDGYVWTITDLSARNYTLDMLTKDVVSAETVTISEISGNVAFYEDEITIKNQILSGDIQINNGYTFQTTSPFIALEKSDGTRIGAFTVTATIGESTGIYQLTLRGEYDFTEDEELKVIYSPLNDTNVYVGQTTITELLKLPTLNLQLQQ